jgi:hypothetical protein
MADVVLVDLRTIEQLVESQNKILRRLDSIDEEQRQHGHKLEALFTAPLLSTDVVSNDEQLLALAPSLARGWQRGDDGGDDQDDTIGCACLCEVLRDWYVLLTQRGR